VREWGAFESGGADGQGSVDSTRGLKPYVDVSRAHGRACCCESVAASYVPQIEEQKHRIVQIDWIFSMYRRGNLQGLLILNAHKSAAESISGRAQWWLPSRSAPPIHHLIASPCRCRQRIPNPTRNRRHSRC